MPNGRRANAKWSPLYRKLRKFPNEVIPLLSMLTHPVPQWLNTDLSGGCLLSRIQEIKINRCQLQVVLNASPLRCCRLCGDACPTSRGDGRSHDHR